MATRRGMRAELALLKVHPEPERPRALTRPRGVEGSIVDAMIDCARARAPRSWFELIPEPNTVATWHAYRDLRAEEYVRDTLLAEMPPMLPPGTRIGRRAWREHGWAVDGLIYPDTSRAAQGNCGTVETERWSPMIDLTTGENTGYVERTSTRTIGEVSAALSLALGRRVDRTDEWAEDAWPYSEVESWSVAGFAQPMTVDDRGQWHLSTVDLAACPWPVDSTIACYAVRGSSEGWYVHVDAIDVGERGARTTRALLQIKTFGGALTAYAIAAQIAQALGVCS